jgi:lipid II:glycine glycyltransferase (peptidoglycan interpeptide bridge formation enzyme)
MKIVLARELSEADATLYDAFVSNAAGGHYSQTRAWGPVADAGKSVQSAYFLASDENVIVGAARVQRARLGPLALPAAIVERGPIVERPEILEQIVPLLIAELRSRGVARISVMPYFADDQKKTAEEILQQLRFRDVQKPGGAHVRTLRIDLENKNADALFSGGERESLRRKLREAEKAGLRVRRADADEVNVLHQLHDEMMLAQSKQKKSPAYFEALKQFVDTEDRAALFVAERDGKSIAALFVIACGSLATFVIGATTQRSLPFSKMASAMAEAIRWAHANGCKRFDLGGIPAQNDADPKRASIAQFKFDFSKTATVLAHEHARWF